MFSVCKCKRQRSHCLVPLPGWEWSPVFAPCWARRLTGVGHQRWKSSLCVRVVSPAGVTSPEPADCCINHGGVVGVSCLEQPDCTCVVLVLYGELYWGWLEGSQIFRKIVINTSRWKYSGLHSKSQYSKVSKVKVYSLILLYTVYYRMCYQLCNNMRRVFFLPLNNPWCY